MNTEQVETYVSDVTITDREAVKRLLRQYRFPADMGVFTLINEPTLRINCTNTYPEAYTTADDEPDEEGVVVPHTLAWHEFLTDLTSFVDPDDELVLQVVGVPQDNAPITAVEWVVSKEGVGKTAFTVGDSETYPVTRPGTE